jgi:hypothetical protein
MRLHTIADHQTATTVLPEFDQNPYSKIERLLEEELFRRLQPLRGPGLDCEVLSRAFVLYIGPEHIEPRRNAAQLRAGLRRHPLD